MDQHHKDKKSSLLIWTKEAFFKSLHEGSPKEVVIIIWQVTLLQLEAEILQWKNHLIELHVS